MSIVYGFIMPLQEFKSYVTLDDYSENNIKNNLTNDGNHFAINIIEINVPSSIVVQLLVCRSYDKKNISYIINENNLHTTLKTEKEIKMYISNVIV